MGKIIREIFDIKTRNWTLLLSILICIVLSNSYFATVDFDTLTNFKDRVIGQNMLLGVNGGARATTYLVIVILFSICFIFQTVFFSFLLKKYEKIYSPEICAFEKKAISTFSITAIFTFLLGIYFPSTLVAGLGLKILLTGILLALILLVIKIYIHKDSRFTKLLENTNIIIVFTLLCGSVLFYIRIILVRLPSTWLFWSVAFLILFMCCYVAYTLFQYVMKRKNRSINILDTAILFGGIPMMMLPFFVPIANEIQYTLSGKWMLSAEKVSYVISLLLMILGTTIFLLIRNGVIRPKTTIKVIIDNVYFPIVIATIALFVYYTPTTDILHHQFEFHFGTHTLGVQQLFQFGRIPFVDNFPARGASDLLEQTLYSLVNGYRFPFDGLLWEWMRWVSGIVLCYFLVKEVLSPAQSLLFICFFWNPIMFSCVNVNYVAGFIVIPALVIKKIYTKQTFRLFCILWISGILVFAWALPLGMITIAGSVFMVVLLILNSFLRKGNWIKIIKQAFGSFVIVLSVVFIFFSTLVLLRGYSLSDHIILIKNLFGSLMLAHTYPIMIRDMTPWAFFEYVVQVVVAIGIVLYTIINIKKKPANGLLPFFVFLAASNVVGILRIIQRHSVIDFYRLFFPIYLIASLPIIFRWVKKQKYLVFILLSTSMAITFIFVVEGDNQDEKYGLVANNMRHFQFIDFQTDFQGERLGLVTNMHQFQFIDWQDKQERVTYEIPHEIETIVKFLNKNLQEGQTFYDFTDTPELFVLSQKEHPLYITSPHMNLSDKNQNVINLFLQDAYNEEKIPYVIFNQGRDFWDYFDGVPRELVSYRTTEFIYRYYHPAYQVSRFEVWEANFIESEPDELAEAVFESLNFSDLESIQQNDVITAQKGNQGAMKVSAFDPDPYINKFLDLSEIKVLEKDNDAYFLRITYQTELKGNDDFQVFYAFEGEKFTEKNSILANIRESSDGDDNLLVIKLNQSINHAGQRLEALRFDFPLGSQVIIKKVEYLVDDRNYFLENKTKIHQQFDLVKLPYIWGTYDEKDAVHTTEVLQTLVSEDVRIMPNEPQTFLINPLISKENGNYIHFRIRASERAKIKFYYTNPEESYFVFDAIPSDQPEEYLVRVSTQWQWMSEEVNELVVSSTGDLVISELHIQEGD